MSVPDGAQRPVHLDHLAGGHRLEPAAVEGLHRLQRQTDGAESPITDAAWRT